MRYFTAFLIAIGLIVLIFVIILKGGSGPKQPTIDLNSYANSEATVQLTIDGPINADQTHHGVQITIGRSESIIHTLQGYQGDVASAKTYQNNQDAYAVFLHALSLIGFTKGNTDPKLSDERGYCPNGERYVFELTQGSDNIERFWGTSCGGGTYGGNVQETLQLFQQQIPDYETLTSNLGF